jgi:vacuolar protein sorting-associated protein 13A/C
MSILSPLSSPLFQIATGGLESYVFDLITTHVGSFINLSREQLNISAWAGEGVAECITVRPDALRALGVPLRVRTGQVAKIRVIVPWQALKSQPVTIRLEGVTLRVVAESRKQVVVAGEQEAHVALVAMGVAQLMLSSQMQARRAVH